MILDLTLVVLIIIIIGATMIDIRDLMENIREIQDDIMGLLSRIPTVYTLTILLMVGILIMSFLVAVIPKS
jgi:hypothetical protein